MSQASEKWAEREQNRAETQSGAAIARNVLELVEGHRDVEIVYSPNLNRWIVYVKKGNWIGNEQVSFQALGNSGWCRTPAEALDGAVKEMKQANGKERRRNQRIATSAIQ